MKKLLILLLLTPLLSVAQMDSTLQFKIDSLGKVMAYNNRLLNKKIDSVAALRDSLVGIIGEIKLTQNGSTGTIGIDPIFTQRLEAMERKLAAIKQIL